MNFEEIEELNFDEINELYNGFIEFGDDTQFADCCCSNSRWTNNYRTLNDCQNWCRSLSSRCKKWGPGSGMGACTYGVNAC